jgi:hypothetical protein
VKQVGELPFAAVQTARFVGAHAAEKDASVFAIHANSFADLPKATYSTKIASACRPQQSRPILSNDFPRILRLWVRLVREVFMATQFLVLVLVFFAVGTAAYVELVNIGVIYSW